MRNLEQYQIRKKLDELEENEQKRVEKRESAKKRSNYEPINYLTCSSTKIVDTSNVIHKKKRCEIIPTCMINVFEEKEKKPPVQLKPIKARGRPKGPFRCEEAVTMQKTRAPSPTLRVATPFDLQDESKRFEKKIKWINRIQDPMVSNKKFPYLSLLSEIRNNVKSII